MSRIPSVMSHNFSQVPSADIPRSSFDRSHGNKTTFDAGYLVPIFVDEALPGDTFNCKMQGFGRLATPLHPFMDNLYIETQFFAVPLRLVWDNFQKFQGEQENPGDSIDFVTPQMVAPTGGYAELSLADYFAIPTKVEGLSHSSLFHRAHNLIWNEWYRDENLQDSLVVDKGDGPDDPADYPLQRRGKRHDYFTSALPWPQKGPAVNLPLGSLAPVSGIGIRDTAASDTTNTYFNTDGSQFGQNAAVQTPKFNGGSAQLGVQAQLDATTVGPTNLPQIYADLSEATASTINELRQAFQIQKLYERDARGGTRYTEIVRSHFGVTSPDARLQRPEYLGGGSTPININPIAQTSATDAAVSPQGNLAAQGTLSVDRHGFTKSFTEHSIIIGFASVRADLNYQQGLNRMWTRSTRFDYYMPVLSHLGEQAVLNKEIYAQGPTVPSAEDPDDEKVFGFQERFAEYRYKPSTITGRFRSNATQTLDSWHLAQDFDALPVLNDEFIIDEPPVDRVIAVQTEPHIIWDSYFKLTCARPMPTYSVPGLIDHF